MEFGHEWGFGYRPMHRRTSPALLPSSRTKSESTLDPESAAPPRRGPVPASTIADLSRQSPVLLVFLRHTGCTFCREAATLRKKGRTCLDGTQLLAILCSSICGTEMRSRDDVLPHPGLRCPGSTERSGYRLGLRRGSLFALLHPRVRWRGCPQGGDLEEARLRRSGDVAQLPGVFLIRDGRVAIAHRHRFTSERPDYLGLCQLPPPQPE